VVKCNSHMLFLVLFLFALCGQSSGVIGCARMHLDPAAKGGKIVSFLLESGHSAILLQFYV